MPPSRSMTERFWEKVDTPDPETGCLVWNAARHPDGYGVVWDGRRSQFAHRVAWFLAFDEWPCHELDHVCRNRACVNVAHLQDVQHAENVRRGKAGEYLAARTVCVNGHEFTPENTGHQRNGRGRYCRACKREASRRKRARARACLT